MKNQLRATHYLKESCETFPSKRNILGGKKKKKKKIHHKGASFGEIILHPKTNIIRITN